MAISRWDFHKAALRVRKFSGYLQLGCSLVPLDSRPFIIGSSQLEKQSALEQWYSAKFQLVPEPPLTITPASPFNTKFMFEPITFLRDVFDFIEANYQQPISLSDVAQSVGYSAAELTSLVRRQTGKTVFRWIIERRMAEAHSLLLQADLSVEQIAAAVSYSDVAYFHHLFRKYHNMTPQEWRRNILVQHGVNK